MEQKANIFIKVFDWATKQGATPIGAFIFGMLLGGGTIGYTAYSQSLTFAKREIELTRDLDDEKKENNFLQAQLNKADENCAERFTFIAQTIDEIKKGVKVNAETTKKLAETEKKSNDEIEKINKKIKGKL